MWSGPRNISTAMMRSFGNRDDCHVTDEPLYACYLQASGAPHPMREAVIAAQSTDWRGITQWLTGPVPGDRPLWYQKHMTHHLLDHVGRDWMDHVENCFLIRDPRAVLASYARKRNRVSVDDVGIRQQAAIFDHVVARRGGIIPPVIDAEDVLRDPRGTLGRLCGALGIAFSERMLAWPPGRRETDGVWAAHWYQAVERSTGFQTWQPPPTTLPGELEPLAERLWPDYERLRRHSLAHAGA